VAVLGALFGLAVLLVIHELGHYVCARLTGQTLARGVIFAIDVEGNWNVTGSMTAVLAGLPYDNYKRSYRSKYMVALNAEQQLNTTFGVFARLGWNNGREQNWMFTEMDWSVSAGVSANGLRWGRPGDTLAMGFNLGGISAAHQRFLEAGGIGFITGDGALNYAPEMVLESYYDMRLAPGLFTALGWQLVKNPAYNRDRGPVPVVAFRLHAAF
jgi:high affinity Mn2+ porin